MIQLSFHPESRIVFVLLLLSMGGGFAGCAFRSAETEVISTPAAPVWRAEAVERTLRSLEGASAVLRSGASPDASQRSGEVADYLADQLHSYRVQPAATAYRLSFVRPVDGSAGTPTYLPLVVGLVGGRDPRAQDEAVLIYAALDPDRPDRSVSAAWLELGRVYADLVQFYRFPARSIIFVMPVGAHHAAALEAYGRQPVWPMAQVQAVLALGAQAPGAEAWRAIGLPDRADVVVIAPPEMPDAEGTSPVRVLELAREGYTWMLPHVAAQPDRSGGKPAARR